MSQLSASEYQRYSRHLQLPQVGSVGQQQLKQTRALIIGCGGLGAASSLYMAAAGVGDITLLDGDVVELGNLQRQITFSEQDIGHNKATATAKRLQSLNSDISVTAVAEHLNENNAGKFIGNADIVLDCTDDFAIRYIINDNCLALAKPWVYASVFQMSGQCALFLPGKACFRCVFSNTPENQTDCNTAGVLGVLPGILGTLQTTFAIKQILNKLPEQGNQLLLFEAGDMSLQSITFKQNPDCRCTKKGITETTKNNFSEKAAHMPAHKGVAAKDFDHYANDPAYQLIDVRSHDERNTFNLGGTHIPIEELTSKHEKLDATKKLLLYCQSGMRSQLACEQLAAAGFETLNVDGGIIDVLKYR